MEVHPCFVDDWTTKFSTNGIDVMEIHRFERSVVSRDDIVGMRSEIERFAGDVWISVLSRDD